MRGNGAASVTPASSSRPLPVTQHMGRNWLNAETVESCEGVRCRPARSSADVCQRGAVMGRLRTGHGGSGGWYVTPGQRNHPGTRWDVRCVRSKRSVGACPAERLLLSPSDLPERQPAILCSSQRDQHGWQQRMPILSERKSEIAAKSSSYAHNRRMSHPRTHLQHVGSPDTKDNDRVRHPRTGNDRNQKDTDETAS